MSCDGRNQVTHITPTRTTVGGFNLVGTEKHPHDTRTAVGIPIGTLPGGGHRGEFVKNVEQKMPAPEKIWELAGEIFPDKPLRQDARDHFLNTFILLCPGAPGLLKVFLELLS